MSENNIETSIVEAAPEVLETSPETTSEAPKQEVSETVKSAARKFKLKVDGEEIEEELDLSNEAEVVKRLQLAKVAQKRMQEAAELKKYKDASEKDIKDFFELLVSNPRAILADPRLGIDLKKFAAEIIQEQIEEESKSPEQKEKEALQMERDKLKQELENARKAKEEEERIKLETQIANELETGILKSIEENKLPKSPEVLKRIAEAMKIGLTYGINLSPEEVVPVIKQEMYEEIKAHLSNLSEDEIESFVGADKITSIRRNMVKRLKKEVPTSSNIKSVGKLEDAFKKDMPKKKVNSDDFFRNLK